MRRDMMKQKLAGGPAGLTAMMRKSGLMRSVHRFRREEDGSLLIFGLFCFVIMLYLAGVSLDLMRHEERRVLLMNTADRASLAAADLNQTMDPKAVVKEYFLKAGLPIPKDSEIIVSSGSFNEWRTVEVNVSEDMPTWFMNLMGINKLVVPAHSVAEERVGQVEISLVLDVSGSMNSNNRLINLKPAAKSFVDTMFDTVEPGKLSISIISYSTQVSLGTELAPYFNMSGEHVFSNCIEFNTADFSSTAVQIKPSMVLPSTPQYARNGHFDPFNATNPAGLRNCPTVAETSRDTLAFSGDRAALKAHIDNLTASGNTSIDLGMKWGAALLDPSVAPIIDNLISKNKRPAIFGDRPYPFVVNGKRNNEVMKVIVLMTDGENTTEYKLKSNRKVGNSIITGNNAYAATNLAGYSLWDASKGQYYLLAKSTWRNEPWGDGAITTCVKSKCTTVQDTGDAVQLTWPEVWDRMSVNYVADKIISPAWGSTARYDWRVGGTQAVSSVVNTTKDTLSNNICSAAKNNYITVFTIGFEAPPAGVQMLKACASSASTYYAASGTNISTAFAGIASSINKLRLTN
jgi:Flp pilus assembly protein TadG